jgi:hypothetical protein
MSCGQTGARVVGTHVVGAVGGDGAVGSAGEGILSGLSWLACSSGLGGTSVADGEVEAVGVPSLSVSGWASMHTARGAAVGLGSGGAAERELLGLVWGVDVVAADGEVEAGMGVPSLIVGACVGVRGVSLWAPWALADSSSVSAISSLRRSSISGR